MAVSQGLASESRLVSSDSLFKLGKQSKKLHYSKPCSRKVVVSPSTAPVTASAHSNFNCNLMVAAQPCIVRYNMPLSRWHIVLLFNLQLEVNSSTASADHLKEM